MQAQIGTDQSAQDLHTTRAAHQCVEDVMHLVRRLDAPDLRVRLRVPRLEIVDAGVCRHRARALNGGTLPRTINTRRHLILKWLDDLIRDPRVLNPVEFILGSDILCWASGFFAKAPGDGSFVSWHQDATYWGLSSNEVVTAWIALSPSTPETGCMRVVPGSQARQLGHRDTFDGGQSAVARPGDLG